jgi:hypothetical protein
LTVLFIIAIIFFSPHATSDEELESPNDVVSVSLDTSLGDHDFVNPLMDEDVIDPLSMIASVAEMR